MRKPGRRLAATAFTVALAGLTAAAAVGQQAPQPAAPTGAVSGVVINGVTKQPIADALVDVGWPTQREYPEFVKPQYTDARGRFVLTGLPANTLITVRATKSGFLVNGTGSLDREPTVAMVLKQDEWFSSATIALWPPSSISGIVRDERGEPLIGVFVRLLAQVRVGAAMRWAAGNVVLTDDRGQYRIGMLGPGRYLVMVPSVQNSFPASATAIDLMTPETAARYRELGRRPAPLEPMVELDASSRLLVKGYPAPPPPVGGRLFTYPMTFAGGTTLATATPIVLGAGEDRASVDVTLMPAPASQLSGVVQGPGDSQANVFLRLLADGLDELGLGSEAATTLTRPDGSFTFPNVPAGNYIIEAPLATNEFVIGRMAIFYAPSLPFSPAARGGPRIGGGIDAPGFGFVASPVQSKVWARSPVTVSSARETGVVVTLNPALSVSGRLLVETSPNRPPPSTPARFLHIQSATGSARLGTTYNRDSARANNGLFAITDLLPGAYLFYPDDTVWMIKSVMVNGQDHTHTPLDIASSIADVVVTFTNDLPTLSGTVTGVNTTATVAVLAFPVESAQWTNYGLRPQRIKVARASTTGTFTFRNLPAGSYNVIAIPAAQGYDWREPGYFQRAQPLATRVSLDWGQKQSVTLPVRHVR